MLDYRNTQFISRSDRWFWLSVCGLSPSVTLTNIEPERCSAYEGCQSAAGFGRYFFRFVSLRGAPGARRLGSQATAHLSSGFAAQCRLHGSFSSLPLCSFPIRKAGLA